MFLGIFVVLSNRNLGNFVHVQNIASKLLHALPCLFVVFADTIFNSNRIFCAQNVKDSLVSFRIFFCSELFAPVFEKEKFGYAAAGPM